MHELFLTVLSRQELSRAGELFSLEDEEVLPCAAEVLLKIRDSVIRPTYAADDNAQSVVEICLARVIAAIRYDCSMAISGFYFLEKHSYGLISKALESSSL